MKEELNQAFELFDKGFLKEAEALYNECLEMIYDKNSNEYTQVLNGLGYVKSALSKFDEARGYYHELYSIAIANEEEINHCIAVHQLGIKNSKRVVCIFSKLLGLAK